MMMHKIDDEARPQQRQSVFWEVELHPEDEPQMKKASVIKIVSDVTEKKADFKREPSSVLFLQSARLS